MNARELKEYVDRKLKHEDAIQGDAIPAATVPTQLAGWCRLDAYNAIRDGFSAQLWSHSVMREFASRRLLNGQIKPVAPLLEDGILMAPFGVLADGETLVDVEFVFGPRMRKIVSMEGVPQRKYLEVQAWMALEDYDQVCVIFVPDDWGKPFTKYVHRNEQAGERALKNLQAISGALARRQTPVCNCRKCQGG